ncbi:ASCH domain-containing protein [Mesorhizobium sp. WSM3626]|uniref:ASCH domain-containing protein n=1 Tax=Mesorhizobium sp. WSM3626 TaxID=1040987 RepID=UPI000518D846|nr:ASCH domain-containing protein [Mesorhizobium sp. WSM3626]
MLFNLQTPDGSTGLAIERLKTKLAQEFPGLASVPRRRFVMAEYLAEMVLQRRKCTTIRYDRNAVEYPAESLLPLYSLEEGQDRGNARCLADLRIVSVRYATVDELSDSDAENDGFDSRYHLLETLESFYGRLDLDDTVCIYAFQLAAANGMQTRANYDPARDIISI